MDCPVTLYNRGNKKKENEKGTLKRTFVVQTIICRFVFVDLKNRPWLANLDQKWPNWTVISQFGPEMTKTDCDWPIWTQNDQNGSWMPETNRDCSILIKNGSITIRFGHFWSKLAKHGPVWSFLVQIGQSWSVLTILGPNWLITVRFGYFGPKSVDDWLFW